MARLALLVPVPALRRTPVLVVAVEVVVAAVLLAGSVLVPPVVLAMDVELVDENRPLVELDGKIPFEAPVSVADAVELPVAEAVLLAEDPDEDEPEVGELVAEAVEFPTEEPLDRGLPEIELEEAGIVDAEVVEFPLNGGTILRVMIVAPFGSEPSNELPTKPFAKKNSAAPLRKALLTQERRPEMSAKIVEISSMAENKAKALYPVAELVEIKRPVF